MRNLDDVLQALNNIDLSQVKPGIRISPGETVEDPGKFISSSISILQSNPGNKTFLPYFNRLKTFVEIVKK